MAAHIEVWLWVLSQFGYRSNTAGETADGHVDAYEPWSWTAAIDVAVKLAICSFARIHLYNLTIALALHSHYYVYCAAF